MGNLFHKSKKREQAQQEKYTKREEEGAEIAFTPRPGRSAPIDIKYKPNYKEKFRQLKESLSSKSNESFTSPGTETSSISEPYRHSPVNYFIQWSFDESFPSALPAKKKYKLTTDKHKETKAFGEEKQNTYTKTDFEDAFDDIQQFPLIDSYATYTLTPTTTKIVDKLVTSL